MMKISEIAIDEGRKARDSTYLLLFFPHPAPLEPAVVYIPLTPLLPLFNPSAFLRFPPHSLCPAHFPHPFQMVMNVFMILRLAARCKKKKDNARSYMSLH